jgi:hypothetical protein
MEDGVYQDDERQRDDKEEYASKAMYKALPS